MGWSIGFDEKWKRDIGYGVPAYCDHPGCRTKIDRGLAFVCADEQLAGGEHGCGLFFCDEHRHGWRGTCARCEDGAAPFDPKPEHPEWMAHVLSDDSWKEWRQGNPETVTRYEKSLLAIEHHE